MIECVWAVKMLSTEYKSTNSKKVIKKIIETPEIIRILNINVQIIPHDIFYRTR